MGHRDYDQTREMTEVEREWLAKYGHKLIPIPEGHYDLPLAPYPSTSS